MSRTSKSPRAVALEALATAHRALPAYSSRFSRRDFTLAQHFACLVLKSFRSLTPLVSLTPFRSRPRPRSVPPFRSPVPFRPAQ